MQSHAPVLCQMLKGEYIIGTKPLPHDCSTTETALPFRQGGFVIQLFGLA